MNNDAASSTYELASFANRLVAYIIDMIILSLIGFVVISLIGNFVSTYFQLIILDIAISGPYYWYFWTRRNGQTPGKKMMNIRVIKTDGSPLSDTDAILRIFGYYVGRFTLFFGYIWAAFDAKSQAWHDKMANTYVVVATIDSKKKTITI